MASKGEELEISYELTEIVRRTKEEIPESAAKKVDEIWKALEMVVAEINKSREGKSSVPQLNEMDPKEALRLAERAAFRRLNDTLREELGDDQDREAEE